MNQLTKLIAGLGALAASASAFAAPETFFGEDLNAGTDGESNPPLTERPNADAARAAFYERLVNGVETEDFEGLTDGAVPPMQLHFGPDTADISGTVRIRTAFYVGHYAVSGTNYLDVGHDANPKSFHIDFSSPQSAFGFYATDLGDAGAQIQVTLHHPSGPDTDILVPNTLGAGSGSVLYFGVLDTENPFDVVTISRLPSDATDGFGFDDMVIARAEAVVPVVDAFFLPKKVLHRPNATTPAKGLFVASGFFDTGSSGAGLSGAATLTIGTREFQIPDLVKSPDGRTYSYAKDGLSFTVRSNPARSSKAKFVLRFRGDLAASAPTTGSVELRFRNAAVDGRCVVQLAKGAYKLGKIRGALSAPNLFLVRAKASVPGSGKDTMTAVLGLASGGTTPAAAPDLVVQFGPKLSVPVQGSQFTRKGDQYVFQGDANGLTSVKLDYLRETLTVTGKNLDLGTFPAGEGPLRVVVALGSENRGVAVRVNRTGNKFRY